MNLLLSWLMMKRRTKSRRNLTMTRMSVCVGTLAVMAHRLNARRMKKIITFFASVNVSAIMFLKPTTLTKQESNGKNLLLPLVAMHAGAAARGTGNTNQVPGAQVVDGVPFDQNNKSPKNPNSRESAHIIPTAVFNQDVCGSRFPITVGTEHVAPHPALSAAQNSQTAEDSQQTSCAQEQHIQPRSQGPIGGYGYDENDLSSESKIHKSPS